MKKNGFTLLEMLIVLSAISILSVVTYFNLSSIYEKQKIDQFMNQFSQDILFMQQAAISHRNRHMLRWFPNQAKYSVTSSGETDPVLVRYYSSDIQVNLNTFPNPMTYGADGNINRGGTIIVSYKTKTYYIVFQLGRGRFTYYEV
ncbi:hypothetical protein BACCIP111899_03125 [Bacillus rhizoplanae]|uniref:Competence protein ComGD n=1 Tax=Bacillus rhizoplanae TaxID=2880966 RepID=A0ABM8YDM1_9BACI|nr:competence type IV pilus minor pilin ComGD [Bacillus rhizoplanae]CAG9613898.1 hypothetical protein BACCIP111899_03125 [Bacillus rhizoplanae]